MLKHLHTLVNPTISVFSAVHETGVAIYLFKGMPEDPIPSQAMAVIECEREEDILIAKIFDEDHVGDTNTSAMHTLVMDVEGWQVRE